MQKFYYHTRHIPEEQLKLETDSGRRVKEAGLCDVMNEKNTKMLKDYGVSVIETRLVWWELEKEPGVYDWSVLDKRIEKIEKAGLMPGVFPWFMHAPEWENKMVRAECIEHGEKSSIISLWEPRLLQVYDRLFAALAERYKDRIKFLYFSFYGDFGEPQYPHCTKHYKFSAKHAHYGYWCGDKLAREDFQRYLQNKYDSLNDLNEAWNTEFTDWDGNLMPRMPLVANTLERRQDFREWYSESLIDFVDKAGEIIRKHFPDIRAGFPMGGDRERLKLGQIKSLVIKRIAEKYNLLVRWTSMGNEKDYGIIDFQARRVSSAVDFYAKKGFGTEVSLGIPGDMAYHVLYVNLSNGSSLLHNEMTGIADGWDDYYSWKDKMPVLSAKSDIAVFYPVEGEQMECITPERTEEMLDGYDLGITDTDAADTHDLYLKGGDLRKLYNYDVYDSYMIADGALDSKKDLIILDTCPLPEKTIEKIMKWVNSGGRLWYLTNSNPWILETSADIKTYLEEKYSVTVKECQGEESGVYCVENWPDFEPYISIRKKYKQGDKPVFITLHKKGYSVYLPEEKRIIICE
ncbi:MAG: beta-galactosidase [Clostridia bacterium]|nr:beta-galactosidase [Clostridia bacterium]